MENQSAAKGSYLIPDPAKRAAKCLVILRHLSEQGIHQIWSLAVTLSPESHTSSAVRDLLSPLVSNLAGHLDEELHRLQVVATPEEILRDVAGLIGRGEEMTEFPKTRATLGNASRALAQANTPNDYQNVANTCRQALIEFGQELYREDYRPKGEQGDPKKGHAVRRLSWSSKYLLRSLGRSTESRFAEVFNGVIKDTWDLAASLSHDTKASLDDARLCLMHTYFIVWRLSRAFAAVWAGRQGKQDAD